MTVHAYNHSNLITILIITIIIIIIIIITAIKSW